MKKEPNADPVKRPNKSQEDGAKKRKSYHTSEKKKGGKKIR